VPPDERGEPREIRVLDHPALGLELSDDFLHVDRIPVHDDVEQQTERAELFLLPLAQGANDALSAARTEIVAAIKVYGLPALDKLADSASLLTLWGTGISPGRTELQARQYAERLRAIVVQ
jgi:hypothetical protein